MSTIITEKISTFLKGTSKKEENLSVVKMLPYDMVEKIIFEFYDGYPISKNLEIANLFYFDYKFNRTGTMPFSFEQALHQCIYQKKSILIDWYFSKPGHSIPKKSELDRAVDVACITGNLNLLVYLHNNFQVVGKKTLDLAVSKGQVDVMKWLLLTFQMSITMDHLLDAIKSGNEDVLKCIYDIDPSILTHPAPFPLIDFACNHNQLHIVKWLNENHPCPGYSRTAMRNAIFHENVELIVYLELFFENNNMKKK